MSWQEWFSKNRNHQFEIMCKRWPDFPTVDTLYKMFRARLLEEGRASILMDQDSDVHASNEAWWDLEIVP